MRAVCCFSGDISEDTTDCLLGALAPPEWEEEAEDTESWALARVAWICFMEWQTHTPFTGCSWLIGPLHSLLGCSLQLCGSWHGSDCVRFSFKVLKQGWFQAFFSLDTAYSLCAAVLPNIHVSATSLGRFLSQYDGHSAFWGKLRHGCFLGSCGLSRWTKWSKAYMLWWGEALWLVQVNRSRAGLGR